MLLQAIFVFLLAKPVLSITPENQVQTPFGIVSGNLNSYSREFLGIPYALPPVRFEPPMRWNKTFAPNGTLDARHFAAECMQVPTPGKPPKMSEDCLTLNVFSPRLSTTTEQRSYPVMLWIHGGALTTGSAMLPIYNGSFLVHSQKVVVVAINYRLNVFGFLPVKRKDGTVSANNGFRDQQMAMQWVQDNIHAFGGDPLQVTLFGESAGGQSTGVHLVSPSSKGLFHRAIMQSADVANTRSLAYALQVSGTIAKAVSCSTLACLQTVNATTLMLTGAKLDTSPDSAVVDGQLLPGQPEAMVKANRWNPVPLILGTNADEGALFIALALMGVPTPPAIFTDKMARCAMNRSVLGARPTLSTLEALYPLTPGVDNRQSVSDYMSDVMFHCANRRFGLAVASAPGSKGVWMYSFKRAPACPLAPVAGAVHTSEIEYVFQTTHLGASGLNPGLPLPPCPVPEMDLALSTAMATLWGGFAHTGSVSARSWRQLRAPPSDFLAKLDIGTDAQMLDVEQGYRQGQCRVLEGLGVSSLNWHLLLAGVGECASRPSLR